MPQSGNIHSNIIRSFGQCPTRYEMNIVSAISMINFSQYSTSTIHANISIYWTEQMQCTDKSNCCWHEKHPDRDGLNELLCHRDIARNASKQSPAARSALRSLLYALAKNNSKSHGYCETLRTSFKHPAEATATVNGGKIWAESQSLSGLQNTRLLHVIFDVIHAATTGARCSSVVRVTRIF